MYFSSRFVFTRKSVLNEYATFASPQNFWTRTEINIKIQAQVIDEEALDKANNTNKYSKDSSEHHHHPRAVSDKNNLCRRRSSFLLTDLKLTRKQMYISNNIYCIFTNLVLKSSSKLITKICTGINLIITLQQDN